MLATFTEATKVSEDNLLYFMTDASFVKPKMMCFENAKPSSVEKRGESRC